VKGKMNMVATLKKFIVLQGVLLLLAGAVPAAAAPDQFGLLKARSLGMAGTGIAQINDQYCDPLTLNPASIGATPFHNVSFAYHFGAASFSSGQIDDYHHHYLAGSGILALGTASFFAGVTHLDSEDSRTFNIMPGAGISLFDETLFLGTTFKIWRGVVEIPGPNLETDFNVSTEAGIIYWPYEPISIGFLFGTNSTDQARSYNGEPLLVEVPLRFGLGVTSYLLQKKLTLNIDFHWYDYQDIEDVESEANILIGFEYRIPIDEYLGIPVRFGFGFNWFDAQGAADRGGVPLSFGIGIDTTYMALDVSYIHIENSGGVEASSNDIAATFSLSF